MTEKKEIIVANENIEELAKKVKAEISKLKGKMILGIFNNKIPVLLKAEHELFPFPFPFPLNQDENRRFRIHYDEPFGEWWISMNEREERIFTFYIPEELKKLVLDDPSPERFILMKERYMSSLSFTYKFANNHGTTVKLLLDTAWINDLRANQ